MPYSKPDAFVSITIDEPSPTILTPAFYPAFPAPHFFVAYKEPVTDTGNEYYEGNALKDVAYPGLPNQSIDTNEKLDVDIGDLAANANDAQGDPNAERFDPDVFVVTDDGVEVEVSLAEGLLVTADDFTLPANMTFNKSTGSWVATKGDVADGDLSAAGTSDWTVLSTTNDPALSKVSGDADYNNDQALQVTLHGTPDAGDGVKSTSYVVEPEESYQVTVRAKTDETDSVNFTVQVYDETNGAVISENTANANTAYNTFEFDVTIPANCQNISVRLIADAGTADAILFLGSAHVLYQGEDLLTGSILVSYRALEEKYSGARLTRLEASSYADLVNLFGADGLGPANPLGHMMYQAWVHTRLPVRGLALGNPANDDGTSSYSGAIDDEVQAHAAITSFMDQSPDDYYAIALATFNEAVWDTYVSYADALAATNKHWARIVVGGAINTISTFRRGGDGTLKGEFASASIGQFTDGDVITYNGTNYTLTVIDGQAYAALPLSADTNSIAFDYDGSSYNDGAFTIEDAAGVTQVFEVDGANFLTAGYKKVNVNDTLTMGADAEYTVLTVRTGALVVEYSAGTEQGGGFNKDYTIFRYLTLDGTETGTPDKPTMAEMARDRAAAYANERLRIVTPGWVSESLNNEWVDVESWYVAAQAAAEYCFAPNPDNNQGPGFPVGLGYTGFREAKSRDFRSIRYFTGTQLDTIAGGGNDIIINDNPGEVLRSRHTLTTDTSAIEYQEAMMGVARDYVAYTFRGTMKNMIQRFRIGPPLGSAIMSRLGGVRATIIGDGVVDNINITTIESGETADAVSVEGTMTQIYPLNKLDIGLKVVQPVPFTVSL